MNFANRFYSKVKPYDIKNEYESICQSINKKGVVRFLSEDDKLYTTIYAKEKDGILQKYVTQLYKEESEEGVDKGISAEFMMGDTFMSLETKTLLDENNKPQKSYSGFIIENNGKVKDLSTDETHIYFAYYHDRTREINIEEYNASQSASQE